MAEGQLQKVVRGWCVLYILTCKSGPELVFFVHFDLQMLFLLQRRAFFPHPNFKKWSGAGVFCAF